MGGSSDFLEMFSFALAFAALFAACPISVKGTGDKCDRRDMGSQNEFRRFSFGMVSIIRYLPSD